MEIYFYLKNQQTDILSFFFLTFIVETFFVKTRSLIKGSHVWFGWRSIIILVAIIQFMTAMKLICKYNLYKRGEHSNQYGVAVVLCEVIVLTPTDVFAETVK